MTAATSGLSYLGTVGTDSSSGIILEGSIPDAGDGSLQTGDVIVAWVRGQWNDPGYTVGVAGPAGWHSPGVPQWGYHKLGGVMRQSITGLWVTQWSEDMDFSPRWLAEDPPGTPGWRVTFFAWRPTRRGVVRFADWVGDSVSSAHDEPGLWGTDSSTATGTGSSCPVPLNAAGALLTCVVATRGVGGTRSVPTSFNAGWSSVNLGGWTGGSPQPFARLYWRIADGSLADNVATVTVDANAVIDMHTATWTLADGVALLGVSDPVSTAPPHTPPPAQPDWSGVAMHIAQSGNTPTMVTPNGWTPMTSQAISAVAYAPIDWLTPVSFPEWSYTSRAVFSQVQVRGSGRPVAADAYNVFRPMEVVHSMLQSGGGGASHSMDNDFVVRGSSSNPGGWLFHRSYDADDVPPPPTYVQMPWFTSSDFASVMLSTFGMYVRQGGRSVGMVKRKA